MCGRRQAVGSIFFSFEGGTTLLSARNQDTEAGKRLLVLCSVEPGLLATASAEPRQRSHGR